jgi:hypothetical protein
VCTYVTERTRVLGSGKGPEGWFRLSHCTVYFDHPVHAPLEHSVNIDFVDEQAGPSQRVAVELSPASARALVACIQAALAAAGPLADEAAGTD